MLKINTTSSCVFNRKRQLARSSAYLILLYAIVCFVPCNGLSDEKRRDAFAEARLRRYTRARARTSGRRKVSTRARVFLFLLRERDTQRRTSLYLATARETRPIGPTFRTRPTKLNIRVMRLSNRVASSLRNCPMMRARRRRLRPTSLAFARRARCCTVALLTLRAGII